METKKEAIDDKQTTREEARSILKALCDDAFSGDTKRAALALGRDAEEINAILDGEENVDEDLLMKIRGIADKRDLGIE